MRVSIVIPCFKAEHIITRAVRSVMAQHRPDCNIEVVISADDAGDYGALRDICPELVFVPPLSSQHGTGPGATRNRGIHASSGEVLAFLDADDEWSPNYLAELLPLAKRKGAAFAPTAIYRHGSAQDDPAIITLAAGQSHLTPADFGRWPGSFHPVVMRQLTSGFDHGAGQDVFHALEVLGRIGGRAPMPPSASYCLHLQGGSVTAAASFGRSIDLRYRQRIKIYQNKQTQLQGMSRLQAMQALHRRMAWNKSWLAQGQHPNGFYGYVASCKSAK